jgi:hypothetical protein
VPDTTANNFATWNAVDIDGSLVDGNLKASTGTSGSRTVGSTFGISSGKYYTEFYINSLTESTVFIGVVNTSASAENPNLRIYQYNDVVCYSSSNGNKIIDGTSSAYGATFTNGDVIGVSINLDTNEVTFFKNGTSQGTITTKTFTGHYEIMLGSGSSVGAQVVTVNFGQNPTFSGQVSAASTQRNADSNGKGEFRYAPPSGFLALCEDNLPTPAIADPGDYFKTVLYTGTGSSRAVTGVGFKPDLVWVKSRTNTEGSIIFDSVRGPEKRLLTFGSQTEATSAGGVMSFDDDGYSTAQYTGTNQSGQNYVAWCWKAGVGNTSTNTDGSINSVVSVNQDAGFSIVSYTSTGSNTATETVGHGLNKAPNMIILKNRSAAVNWRVYHSGIPSPNNSLCLNTNEVAFNFWPSVGSDTFGQAAGTGNQDIVAYCWTEIEGYSKFGSYIGNASTDGPFVYCGFKPAFVIIKTLEQAGDWIMLDSSRNSTNPCDSRIDANANNAEFSETLIDFLSNGFKLRTSSASKNPSGEGVVFMAFAESPFKTANAK